MDNFDIPIFKKSYELYKEFYLCLRTFPRADRYSLGYKCESILLEVLDGLLMASTSDKIKKAAYLERVSVKINLFRVYIRLAKDIKAIENKKYIAIQEIVDEIGRMLGGWMRTMAKR